MLKITNLTIETEEHKQIVNGLNISLKKGDKLAIIGEEGNGKSTLLKVINNSKDIDKYCKVSGEIETFNQTIGYLEQSLNSDWNDKEVYEYFVKNSPYDEIEYEKFHDMNIFVEQLVKVGIQPSILDSTQKIGSLSGGEKVKIQIAKLLSAKPEILLLDEPTNDLDLETLEWLESFIQQQENIIIFVSHDETLLERTANMILHLEYLQGKKEARHTWSKTDYATYVKNRKIRLEKQEQSYGREKREYLEDKRILSRQKSAVRTAQIKVKDSKIRRLLNKKMKNILVQERKAEEKKKTERVEVEEPIFMKFNEEIEMPSGKVVLDMKLDKLEVGGRVLSKDINLFVKGAEKVGIIGKNGVGKTTLLKKIKENFESREDISFGYMPQNYNEVLPSDIKSIDYILSALEEEDSELITAYMGRIKLTWEEMNTITSKLSLGQKAKLILLYMMLSKNNVLLLDEPTRNISALSNPVVREILQSYKGAIISISHDRKYLSEVCDTVYELTVDGLRKHLIT
ncbi:MAG: ATP-binding cassette domain-containing protein [Candidatus Dojkabacteria bacterium]|jgi:ATPase subunit of ABC transporter with duplicated ATPase domains